jgi:gamma-glutamyltranspeptidase/glutathione hydrolase
MNVIDFDMSMLEAVSAPRVVAVSNSIDVSNRVTRRTTDGLEAMGYDIKRSPQSHPFAALHAIRIDDGVCRGGADPQRDGMALSVPARAGEKRP